LFDEVSAQTDEAADLLAERQTEKDLWLMEAHLQALQA
jgi:hypothetical protein